MTKVFLEVAHRAAPQMLSELPAEEGIQEMAKIIADDLRTKIAMKDSAKKAISVAARQAVYTPASERIAGRAVQEASVAAVQDAAQISLRKALAASIDSAATESSRQAAAEILAVPELAMKIRAPEQLVAASVRDAIGQIQVLGRPEKKDQDKISTKEDVKDRFREMAERQLGKPIQKAAEDTLAKKWGSI
jgi:hypothetical protein